MEPTSSLPKELKQDLKFLDRAWKAIEQSFAEFDLPDKDKELLRRIGDRMADRYQNVYFYDALNRRIYQENLELKNEKAEAIECLKQELRDDGKEINDTDDDSIMSLLKKVLYRPGSLGGLHAKERFETASASRK